MPKAAISEILADVERWESIIERSKIDKAKWEGKLTEIFETMKKKFGVGALLPAEKQLGKRKKELDSAEEKITDRRDSIREKYDL